MQALRLLSGRTSVLSICKANRICTHTSTPALRCFSTSRVLRNQGPPHSYNQQHHQQQNQQYHQQQPAQQQQQQQQQQEIVVPASNKIEEKKLVVEVTESNFNSLFSLDSRQPFILDIYSRHEPNSPAQTEKLIQAAKNTEGQLVVCRLNAERFPDVLESVGATVEHLPIAVFIYGGRPVQRFLGKGDMIDNATLDKCVSVLLKAAGLNSTRTFLKSAEKALDDGDVPAAVEIYKEILHNKQLKAEAVALAGLAMCELQLKNPQGCKELLDVIKTSFKDELENPYVKRAYVAYDLHQSTGGNNETELKEKLAQNPKDLETKYALAVLYSTTNRPELAIEEALGIIKIDKQFNEQAARKFILQVFDMLGSDHPLTIKGRKRLSSLWFL